MDPVRFGLAMRALRRRRAWTQQQLADRADVSRSTVQRIERGGADAFTGRVIRSMAVALGARFDQRLTWQGEALDRLLDADHAAIVERVIRWLRSEGWEAVPEATFAINGERGSIDILAFHPETGTLLVVEVKSVVPDMQGLLAGVDRKARVAPAIARERSWNVRNVGRLVVLPDDRTARRRVESHRATLDAALPVRTAAVRAWARKPQGAMSGILFLADDGARRPRHRIAVDGRHTSVR
ncbi:MAG: helix-turn-helix domain-containing protein [Candidatus Limnocylindrales bacterium]